MIKMIQLLLSIWAVHADLLHLRLNYDPFWVAILLLLEDLDALGDFFVVVSLQDLEALFPG